jgi:transcriptional regulator
MYIAPVDATLGEDEWRPFVEAQGFGHLVAAGRDRDVAVVVPTQFVLDGDTVWLHLVRANPVFDALAENPRVLLSVAGDWAFVPSAWKAIDDEDPTLGIPTTYYGAVQLIGTAEVLDERAEPGAVAAVLRRQLGAFQPEVEVADPAVAHEKKLTAICGIRIQVEEVRGKFKYGGNVDEAHRLAVAERLEARAGPGDAAAAAHARRRSR